MLRFEVIWQRVRSHLQLPRAPAPPEGTLESAEQTAMLRQLQQEAILVILPVLPVLGLALTLLSEGFQWGTPVSILGGLLATIPFGIWWLSGRHFEASAWALVAALMGIDLLALGTFPFDTVAALIALPAGAAAFLLNMPSGAVVAAIGTLIALAGFGAYTPQGGASTAAAIALIWGVLGMVAVVMKPTRQAVAWSWSSYERARQLLEEARQQRVELQETQEDLLRANQELARLTDRLRALAQMAEEARQAKEEFVANVSHELRTPLNMIIGFSEMIMQSPHVYDVTLPPALLADIAAIHRNSQHLASLVDDVLDLSQIEAGRMALSKEWADIGEIIRSAAQAARALFDSKGLWLRLEIAEGIPTIYCDPVRIRQVVLNLISNAGRFTERGGVRVIARQQGDEVIVSVADTGPGIAAEDQEKLFQPFQQLDGSLRRKHGGSGLGLSISKRFVEMHGGRMWLESEVGVGTTVHFTLPVSLPATASMSVDPVSRWFSDYHQIDRHARRRRAPAPTPPPRFVILEQGQTLKRLLSRYMDGVELLTVTDMQAATEVLSKSPAQALVINDPSLKRSAVSLEEISALPFGTPAITCWVPGEGDAAEQLGVVRYLIKPVQREQLLAALDDLGSGIRTVLIVDDEPEALQLFARMLRSSGRSYRVLRAASGAQALALMRERRPDAVVLDMVMPGMDGFEVLEVKRQDPDLRPIPVIVVSARDPMGEPIVSNMLTVTQSGGLSARNLVACLSALSQVLSPSR